MRIMTFNLRFENDRDGENAWINRRELVVEIIDRYQPAILGTQEGKWTQLTYLRDQLPEYEIVMPGRTPDKKIQCPTLFFRKKDCTIEAGRDFWLSKTPDVHLSKDWDSAFPRMISLARIRIEKSYRKIIAAVTHLDNIGVEARFQQAKIISKWADQQKSPIILMGDFNDDPASRAHDVLTLPKTRLCDTWEMIQGSECEESYTHHGFSGVPQLSRMDWILADLSFKVKDARVIHDEFNGRYPSDHFPYLADIEFLC
ncbi:MAG: endonuclease/exonuclease/phosphatase family protein [Desulfobacteraceae bacterium]|nr:endonuclease/exonuclease/phosphatase family protein [Desulfobacteraceae bacterium]MBC2754744.1 endonuclease/exonuclease/phosphatase family protein [Desulfobacteraceae bacterium]